MKYLKYSLSIIALLVVGQYGWYLMATEINKHADSAATAIIEDTLGSNAAYDISQLRKLESKLRDGDIESSMFIVNELIDTKTWQLESCVSEQCRDLMQKRTGKEIYNKALK